MSALLLFVGGVITGVIATISIGIAIINRPPPPRTTPIYSVNAGRSTRTTGPQSLFDQLQSRLR